MAIRRSERKRQSRLAFTPVVSSSPQKSQAFIRVDESSTTPSRKRKIGDSSSTSSQLLSQSSTPSRVQVIVESPAKSINQLPTPAPSSQIEPLQKTGIDVAEISAPNRRGETSKPDHRLVISSSEEDGPVKGSTRRSQARAISISSNDSRLSDTSDDSEPITPNAKRIRKPGPISSTLDTPQDRSTPYRPRRAISFLLGGGQGNAPIPHGGPRKSPERPRRRVDAIETGSSGSASYEDDSSEPPRPERNLRSYASSPPRPSAQKSADLEPQCSDAESDLFITGDRNGSSSDRASVGPSTPGISANPADIDRGSHDSDVPVAPRQRRESKTRSRPRVLDDEELSELEADLADLADSDHVPEPEGPARQSSRTKRQSRTTQRGKRLGKLEELKRRRAGIVDLSDDDDDLEIVDDLGEQGDHGYDADDAELSEPLPDLDEYEADFIDEDAGNHSIGVDLARGGVPLELTGYANLKPFEYFKFEVEWMVHNKLDPAFERNDEIYHMAHRKLDDEVMGHAGSTFKSSVWRADFSAALMSRPSMHRVDFPAIIEQKCEACNRSGHPPTHRLILTGDKYDKNTLDKISARDSEDEKDGESDQSDPERQSFFLGRFCCSNAEIAHALYHWRYHLNETILEWLSMEGYTTVENIVERENWNRKKREKLANKVVDGMIVGGEMKDLYRQFKQNLEAARSTKPERFVNH